VTWEFKTLNYIISCSSVSGYISELMNKDRVAKSFRNKYLKDKTIGEVCWKPGDSHF